MNPAVLLFIESAESFSKTCISVQTHVRHTLTRCTFIALGTLWTFAALDEATREQRVPSVATGQLPASRLVQDPVQSIAESGTTVLCPFVVSMHVSRLPAAVFDDS